MVPYLAHLSLYQHRIRTNALCAAFALAIAAALLAHVVTVLYHGLPISPSDLGSQVALLGAATAWGGWHIDRLLQLTRP